MGQPEGVSTQYLISLVLEFFFWDDWVWELIKKRSPPCETEGGNSSSGGGGFFPLKLVSVPVLISQGATLYCIMCKVMIVCRLRQSLGSFCVKWFFVDNMYFILPQSVKKKCDSGDLHNCGNTTEATTLLQFIKKKKKKLKNSQS